MTKLKDTTRVPMHQTTRELWAYLLGYLADNEVAPTAREIAEHFSEVRGATYSTEWARYALKALEEKGLIKLIPNKHRGIELAANGRRKLQT